MRIVQKNFRTMFVISMIMFTGIACSKNENTPILTNNGVNAQTNSSKFNSLLNARTTCKGKPFEIKIIKRYGNLLKIEFRNRPISYF